MIFLAQCKIDNGAAIYYHKSVVIAKTEKDAKEKLQKHYAPGYDDACYILKIEPYHLDEGDILEIS